jgi:hypothetical protein
MSANNVVQEPIPLDPDAEAAGERVAVRGRAGSNIRMRDLLADYARLAAEGRPFGRAVVTRVWGSAPRPEGSSMLATAGGVTAGSVSGGCVEDAVAGEIADAIR